MDPFIATIIKQSAVILERFIAAGFLAALLVGWYKYAQLQHALTLNAVPTAMF